MKNFSVVSPRLQAINAEQVYFQNTPNYSDASFTYVSRHSVSYHTFLVAHSLTDGSTMKAAQLTDGSTMKAASSIFLDVDLQSRMSGHTPD